MITPFEFIWLIFIAGIAAGALLCKGKLFAWSIVGFVFTATFLWWALENAL